MSIFSKEGRRAWKEKIRTETEKATASFLTKCFQRFGIDNAAERFLVWAESHRKMMFILTISFLGFVTVVSIAMRPSDEERKARKQELKIVSDKVDSLKTIPERELKIREAIELMRFKAKIEEIKTKRVLTKEDTLMIKQYYNKLKNRKVYETD